MLAVEVVTDNVSPLIALFVIDVACAAVVPITIAVSIVVVPLFIVIVDEV